MRAVNQKEDYVRKCQTQAYESGTNSLNDDALIMKKIREITGRGNDAEVRRRGNGKLAVYEVKKSISIG